jgi:hypothetical protein
MRCRCAGEDPAWLPALPAATVSDLASARMFCGDMGAHSRVKLRGIDVLGDSRGSAEVPVDRRAREPARLMATGDAASPDSFCILRGLVSMYAVLT